MSRQAMAQDDLLFHAQGLCVYFNVDFKKHRGIEGAYHDGVPVVSVYFASFALSMQGEQLSKQKFVTISKGLTPKQQKLRRTRQKLGLQSRREQAVDLSRRNKLVKTRASR